MLQVDGEWIGSSATADHGEVGEGDWTQTS